MRQSIDPGTRRHSLRLRKSETRVQNGCASCCFWIAARHFLVRFVVCNEREALAFAPGARSSRYGYQRQHRPGSLADTPIVLHPAAIRQQEITALCCVHAAAAAQTYDSIYLLFTGCP